MTQYLIPPAYILSGIALGLMWGLIAKVADPVLRTRLRNAYLVLLAGFILLCTGHYLQLRTLTPLARP